MRQRRKVKAFDIFYNKYKMLDKFNYIKSVMSSCETVAQLDIAYGWGTKTLWSWHDVIDRECKKKYGVIDGLDFWNYTFKRTSQLTDDLLITRNKIYQRLTRVVV